MTTESMAVPTARHTLIEGSLRDISFADVLQLLARGRRDVAVTLAHGVSGARAVMLLRQGRVVAAELRAAAARRERDVTAVAVEVLAWTSGRVCAESVEAHEMPSVDGSMSVDALLLDAAHAADEWARLGDRVPDAGMVPALSDDATTTVAVELTPLEWQVVAYANGARDLRAIAACAGASVLDVARAAHRLLGECVLAVPSMAAASSSF